MSIITSSTSNNNLGYAPSPLNIILLYAVVVLSYPKYIGISYS